MPDYNKYLLRHGESWVQAIVESIERSRGIRPLTAISLEMRWVRAMQDEQHDHTLSNAA